MSTADRCNACGFLPPDPTAANERTEVVEFLLSGLEERSARVQFLESALMDIASLPWWRLRSARGIAMKAALGPDVARPG